MIIKGHKDHKNDPTLPDYSEDRELPPDYSPPRTYTIDGRQVASALVRIGQIKAHLALLRAIKSLRDHVERAEDPRFPPYIRGLDPSQRWGWFLHLSVERFTRWVNVVQAGKLRAWVETELPPLDVIMVWHTYMLNPAWYAEDCDRIPCLKILWSLQDRLLNVLVFVEDIGTHEVAAARKAQWELQTRTAFDPIDAAAGMTHYEVACPYCKTGFAVAYMTPAATGYAQHDFQAQCPSCSQSFNKVHLAIRKFAHDLVLDHTNPADVARYGHGVYMAGSLRTAVRPDNTAKAAHVKVKLREAYPLNRPSQTASADEWERNILVATAGGMIRIKAAAAIPLFRSGVRVQKLLQAYNDDKPFSVDLVNAIVRQCSFIDKMHDFGWSAPGFFDSPEDELVLQHAIARYHGFLDLISQLPTTMLVPTLDIDLVWHTHQLMALWYQADCGEYIGRYIDHDDKVDEAFLANSFDLSCRAWRERFGVPYTYCGCPLPGDRIGEKFSRLKHRLNGGAEAQCDLDLQPVDRANGSAATHASEHNFFAATSEEKRTRRAEKVKKRQKRGKVQSGAHEPPFLYPIPFYGLVPEAGCVVVGTETSHALGCAVGAGACGAGGQGMAGCVGETGGAMYGTGGIMNPAY